MGTVITSTSGELLPVYRDSGGRSSAKLHSIVMHYLHASLMIPAGFGERTALDVAGEGETMMEDKLQYRTVWNSDVHLGTKACQVEPLLKFISSMRCQYLFLVGDIIDLWAMRRKWYWPQSHNDVIRKILKRASKGTAVTYIPGNHDENFRGYLGLNFGGVEVKREALHVTADGKRVLMLHGDEFDTVVTH